MTVASARKPVNDRAALAATAVAAGLDLDARDAEVLAGSNNTIVLLPRAQAVAKVGTSGLRGAAAKALTRELEVVRYLQERHAPIVRPLSGELAGPHETDGFVLTLWSFCPTTAEPERGASLEAARTLGEVHDALADYPGELPALGDHLARAAALVADPNATPLLAEDDRRTLLSAHEACAHLVAGATETRPLHGEPHDGNFLWTENGPRLIDFEATCRGPLEWDIAYFPDETQVAFPDARPELVRHCRLLVSFAVAAWCWSKPDRSLAVAEAARIHLGKVREWRSQM